LAEEPNYLAQAFKSQYNLIGLGTAIGFAILSGSALPLLLAAGVQLAVLPLVAGSDRFQRLVKARALEAERGERQEKKQAENSEMLRALPDAERTRYRGLETLAGEIRQNYRGLDSASQALLDELVQKLDFLLAFYLRMRYSVARYEAYFQTTDPERLRERMAMLEHEVKEGPERLRQIKAKTREVLVKRLVRYEKALENKQLIDAQTETVLEVTQLLRDQSYSMRDPRTITEQLDGLVSSAEETERGVKDMEDLLSAEQDLLLPGGLGEDVEAELGDLGAAREAARAAPSPLRLPPAPVAAASPPPPPRKKLTH
jgi:hypothetical protein